MNKWEGPWDLITWGRRYVCFYRHWNSGYLPGVSVLPYIVLRTRDNILMVMLQQMSRSRDLNNLYICDTEN